MQKLDHLPPQQAGPAAPAAQPVVAPPDLRVAQAPLFQEAVVVEDGEAVDDEEGGLGVKGGGEGAVVDARVQDAIGDECAAPLLCLPFSASPAPGTASTASWRWGAGGEQGIESRVFFCCRID